MAVGPKLGRQSQYVLQGLKVTDEFPGSKLPPGEILGVELGFLDAGGVAQEDRQIPVRAPLPVEPGHRAAGNLEVQVGGHKVSVAYKYPFAITGPLVVIGSP